MDLTLENSSIIEPHAFHPLLLGLYRREYGGELVLEYGVTHRCILFEKGYPIYAESDAPQERMLASLVAEGLLTDKDAQQVEHLVAKTGCSEEKALLALRVLDPKALLQLLHRQTRRRLLNCFTEQRASYHLQPRQEANENAVYPRLDPLSILKEGLSTPNYRDVLNRDLEPFHEKFPRTNPNLPGLLPRLELQEEWAAQLSNLRGKRSLREISEETSAPDSLACLWILHHLDAFRYQEERTTNNAPTVEEMEIEVVVAESPHTKSSRTPSVAAKADISKGQSPQNESNEALCRDILERHRRLLELNYYQLLDVSEKVSASELKRAYFKLAKRYHPDALARAGLESLKTKANEVFSKIAKAYAVLSDPEKRKEYEHDSQSGTHSEEGNRLMEAENLFRKGEFLLRMGNFKGALKLLKPAVELWPDDATYQAALGWSLYRATDQIDEAKQHLETALRLDPNHVQAHHYLSSLLGKLGDAQGAARLAARAKQLDPTNRTKL